MRRSLDKPLLHVNFNRRRLIIVKGSEPIDQAAKLERRIEGNSAKEREAKNPKKPDTEKPSEYWKCPVCGVLFASGKTRKKHIRVHGKERVARAFKEKHNATVFSGQLPRTAQKMLIDVQIPSASIIDRPNTMSKVAMKNMKNACRICGNIRVMSGDDVCYTENGHKVI